MRTPRSPRVLTVALASVVGLLVAAAPSAPAADLGEPSTDETAAWSPGVSCAVPSSSSYGTAVAATPGLVSYWRLDERSGSFACDSAGANPGTYAPSARLGVAGKDTTALGLDGESAALEIAPSPSLRPAGAYSIEAWVRPSSVARSQTVARMPGQYLLRIAGGAVVFRTYRGGGGYHELVSPPVLAAAAWQHLVATDDGATMRIYRDGAVLASAPSPGPPSSSQTALLLGSSGIYDHLAGRLDEVAAYGVALTADQVAQHYEAADTSPPPTPRGLAAETGDGELALRWDAPPDGADVALYRVFRRSPDGTWPLLATVPAPATSLRDEGLVDGTVYAYRITAVDAADNESAPSAQARATPVAPGTVVWRADMEDGTLGAWAESGDGGGYHSGGGDAAATQERAHDGSWAAVATLPDGVGGARLFRWGEARRTRTLTYRAWLYIPRAYTRIGEPAGERFWILDEFKSRTADNAHNDPFWYVSAFDRADGTIGATLAWGYQSRLEGPHQGESGWRNYGNVTVPVARWFEIVVRLRQSKDFDGAVGAWLDGQPLADLEDVRTGWPNCTYNAWCVDTGWAIANYSDGLRPSPASLFIDDAAITG